MSQDAYIANAMALVDGRMQRADIGVEGGRIVTVTRERHNPRGLPVIDAAGMSVLPGLIDLHTHGAVGVDVNAADVEGLRKIGLFFASQGVTSWNCSVLTDTPEQTSWCMGQARAMIEAGAYDGARLAGVHLEGPCLSSEYKGAMPEHLLMHEADPELFRRYQEESGGHVTYVTLAPEVPGVAEMASELTRLGMVVAMGHSGATYAECEACVEAGVRSVTHLGNAMRLFHQHEPSILGIALERGDLYAEAICDGRHLVPATVRMYLNAKGWDRIVAITDSIMAAGLPDGKYKLGVNDVVVVDGDAKLAENGVRAGSTLTLAQALRNIQAFTGCDLAHAARLMTENPARLMGWSDRGRIAPGCAADLVLLDGNDAVRRTMVEGRTVFEA